MDINLVVSLVARYCDYTTLYLIWRVEEFRSDALWLYYSGIAAEAKSAKYNLRACHIRKYGPFCFEKINWPREHLEMDEKLIVFGNYIKRHEYLQRLFPDLLRSGTLQDFVHHILMMEDYSILLNVRKNISANQSAINEIIRYESDNCVDILAPFIAVDKIVLPLDKRVITPEYHNILNYILRRTKSDTLAAQIIAADDSLLPPPNFDFRKNKDKLLLFCVNYLNSRLILKHECYDVGILFRTLFNSYEEITPPIIEFLRKLMPKYGAKMGAELTTVLMWPRMETGDAFYSLIMLFRDYVDYGKLINNFYEFHESQKRYLIEAYLYSANSFYVDEIGECALRVGSRELVMRAISRGFNLANVDDPELIRGELYWRLIDEMQKND